MKFSLEGGHRGLEGINTEGATGWDELGDLRRDDDRRDDNDDFTARAEEISRRLEALQVGNSDAGSQAEPDPLAAALAKIDARREQEFRESEEKAEKINESFGERALQMQELFKKMFGE